MKKIKCEHKPWCQHCPPKTRRAVWRSSGLGGAEVKTCDEHKDKIVEFEKSRQDNGYMTEADHQTWGRL